MKKKRVGLALGGGSVRGLAHIGVLKVLKKHNIPIDLIAGTSIGAVIGAAYCAGIGPKEFEKISLTKDWKKLVDFTIPKKGLIIGQRIKNYVRELTKNKNFSDLDVPLSVVATDLNKQQKVVFERGNVADAVRASISLPGIFNPVKLGNKELVDGALVDPVPFEEVIERGADIVIAVDLSVNLNEVRIDTSKEGTFSNAFNLNLIDTEVGLLKGMFKEKKFKKVPGFVQRRAYKFLDKYFNPKKVVEYLMRKDVPKVIRVIVQEVDILTNQLTKEKLKDDRIDVIIHPAFRGVKWIEFEKARYLIKQGEKAAEKAIPKIKKLLKSK